VPPALERWGRLSTRVLFFERDGSAFRAPAQYARNALATATTHDMIPLAGYRMARDVDEREEAGALTPEEAAREREQRSRDAEDLTAALRTHALSVAPREHYDDVTLREAVHAFVCSTPSVLAGISLDDLAGEVDPVNIPGLSAEVYPCWSRKMRLTLAEMEQSDEVRRLLSCMERTRHA
jgi:4-alpha-glucanotransferase